MNDTTADNDLRDVLSAWLDPTRRGAAQRFPPVLEARFEADTSGARSRAGGLIVLAAMVAALLLSLLLGGVPKASEAANRVIFLEIVVPMCGLIGLGVLTNPPARPREAALALVPAANAASMFIMFLIGHQADGGVLTGASLLLLNFAGVVLQIRFTYMLAFCLLLLTGVGLTVSDAENLAGVQGWNLWIVTAIAAAFMLLANWRLHADQRRNYALILRETLRHDDLSQRNETLDALVRSDALTGLANRRAYDTWLQASWLTARADATNVGLIVLDVDFFKAYNDCYGHAAGDMCLQSISRCLREQLRGTSDLLARLGGEEFAVLLPGLSAPICSDIAERLRQAVEALDLPHLGAGGVVTLSCGAASLPAIDPYEPADLFAAADAALYQAKQTGRNRVCLAAPPAQRDVGVSAGAATAPASQPG